MAAVDIVARRYAQAYFDVAAEAGDIAEWRGHLADAMVTVSDPKVVATVGNPRVSTAERTRLVMSLLDGVSDPARNLVRMMVERNRVGAAARVLEWYDRLADRAGGVVRAEVVAAIPLDHDLEERIRTALAERLGGEVRTTVRHDPAILGGLVIRIGDRVIDGSVRTRLEQLQAALA